MEIINCKEDLQELLLYLALLIASEACLFVAVSWNVVAIILVLFLNIFIMYDFAASWCYLNRRIILGEQGCSFVYCNREYFFTWNEIYIQRVDNSSFLFGDCEMPGNGVILSTKPISKPKRIGAMTYCRYANPRTSIFLRFRSSYDNTKKTTAKFVYRGFSTNESDVLPFIEAMRKQ